MDNQNKDEAEINIKAAIIFIKRFSRFSCSQQEGEKKQTFNTILNLYFHRFFNGISSQRDETSE